MLAQVGALIESTLALKTRQLKLAARAYLDDRAEQGKSAVTSYVAALALFAVALIFLLGACIVGLIALYRWIALWYGQFVAFGSIGGLLVLLAILCIVVAILQVRRRQPDIPSLSSRLISAMTSNPVRLAPPAKAIGRTRPTNPDARSVQRSHGEPRHGSRPVHHTHDGRALLLVAATLLAWSVARYRRRAPSRR
jgi:hypothetical protein